VAQLVIEEVPGEIVAVAVHAIVLAAVEDAKQDRQWYFVGHPTVLLQGAFSRPAVHAPKRRNA
jgi:hypothetical protein